MIPRDLLIPCWQIEAEIKWPPCWGEIFNCIFLNANQILIWISVPDNKSSLDQVIDWRRIGANPLPEPVMTQFNNAHMRRSVSMTRMPCDQHIEAETRWPPFSRRHFKCIFLNENARISLKISLKFVRKIRINNFPALVQIVAWRRSGDKPLTEPIVVSLLTHICVTRPQWINNNIYEHCYVTSAQETITPLCNASWPIPVALKLPEQFFTSCKICEEVFC